MLTLPSPERCQAIAHRLACYDFPWDVTRSLELALFRTFASPRIAGVLHATGEFERRAQRRYDDTDLILATIVENGFDSDLGRRAIARMSAIHGRFRIANEDFLYVLSTFTFEPLRWLDRFGWRALTDEERWGWFVFWREVGKRMHIRDIPEDLSAFEQFNRDYEAACFAGTEVGRSGRRRATFSRVGLHRPRVRSCAQPYPASSTNACDNRSASRLRVSWAGSPPPRCG
jgi:ER-bound oxygenase mpaB/B'/Rubber oxygenase, catalytic domain